MLHWAVFLLLNVAAGLSQAWSNLVAFFIVMTLSFFANARATFKARVTPRGYLRFTFAMGLISFLVGTLGDQLAWPPLVTPAVFSAMSALLGFAFSSGVVLRVSR